MVNSEGRKLGGKFRREVEIGTSFGWETDICYKKRPPVTVGSTKNTKKNQKKQALKWCCKTYQVPG